MIKIEKDFSVDKRQKPVQPLIEFKGVSKNYSNGTHALDDVNIRINKGEFVFVVGPSGAGKSTFMKLIMREEKPNTGEITVNGFKLTKMRRKQVPYFRRTMGIVFQDFQLLPDRTVSKNLEFVLKATGWKKKDDIANRIKKVLQIVELTDKADNFPHELSGGEQQRIAIARAILNNPEIIIADEPTGNLDIITSKHIIDILKSIFDAGTTIIMSTHNLSLMEWVEEAKQYICQDGHLLPASTITTSGNN